MDQDSEEKQKEDGHFGVTGTAVPLLPPAASDLLNGMETFETFIDMTETAAAHGVTLTTLDKFIQRTFGR